MNVSDFHHFSDGKSYSAKKERACLSLFRCESMNNLALPEHDTVLQSDI